MNDNVSSIVFAQNEDENALNDFLAKTIDGATGPMLNKWHESLNASPLGSFFYNNNPLNKMFEGIVKNLFKI